jgi:hypothetical protein
MLKAKNDSITGMVYPYWHPSGHSVAYSSNHDPTVLHAVRSGGGGVRQASDVLIFHPVRHQKLISTKT